MRSLSRSQLFLMLLNVRPKEVVVAEAVEGHLGDRRQGAALHQVGAGVAAAEQRTTITTRALL